MKGNNKSSKTNGILIKFLQMLRATSVVIVTICLLLFLVQSTRDKYEGVLDFIIIMLCVMFFPIVIAILGSWIYSFILSIKGKSKTDRMFLCVHIADIILVIGIFVMLNRPALKCNADIMAQHYDIYNASMLELIDDIRTIVPDSAHMVFEIGDDYYGETPYLNQSQTKELQKRLEDLGCIGIEIGNSYKGKEWHTILFRRVKMGMYSFRFYSTPLTKQEIDSINRDGTLIVYNDSTVFQYGGGVFGQQYFLDKDEFMTKLSKRHDSR